MFSYNAMPTSFSFPYSSPLLRFSHWFSLFPLLPNLLRQPGQEYGLELKSFQVSLFSSSSFFPPHFVVRGGIMSILSCMNIYIFFYDHLHQLACKNKYQKQESKKFLLIVLIKDTESEIQNYCLSTQVVHYIFVCLVQIMHPLGKRPDGFITVLFTLSTLSKLKQTVHWNGTF